MSEHVILGVHVGNRFKNASQVQKVLTEYGCSIKTRIGLHDVGQNFCGNCGLLILELFGPKKDLSALEKKLGAIKGLQVKKMVFKG